MAEDDLQKWIARRVRELDGHRIWWTGKDGNPRHVKLELKEVELSAKPWEEPPGISATLNESARIRFEPAATRAHYEEPDEIDSILGTILELDTIEGDEQLIRGLWGDLRAAVGDNCNMIPSDRTDRCREKLLVFPELVSVLYRRGLLPNPFEFCAVQRPQEFAKANVGVCCALCEATRHVRGCFTSGNGWMNRVVDVRGNPRTIKKAWSPVVRCSELWNDQEVILPRVRSGIVVHPGKDSDVTEMRPEIVQEFIPCWSYFLGAMRRLRTMSGAPTGCPEVLLAGRRTRL